MQHFHWHYQGGKSPACPPWTSESSRHRWSVTGWLSLWLLHQLKSGCVFLCSSLFGQGSREGGAITIMKMRPNDDIQGDILRYFVSLVRNYGDTTIISQRSTTSLQPCSSTSFPVLFPKFYYNFSFTGFTHVGHHFFSKRNISLTKL